jgi:hypothetical protein
MPSSGWMCWQYMAVYGCRRALATAVVAVIVAVKDTGRPSASHTGSRLWAGSHCRCVSDLGAQTHMYHLQAFEPLASDPLLSLVACGARLAAALLRAD